MSTSSTDEQPQSGPVTVPCPSWCTYEPGHDYEETHDDHGNPILYRYHEARFGRPDGVQAVVTAGEYSLSVNGPAFPAGDPVTISVSVDDKRDVGEMDAVEALELTEHLGACAALLVELMNP